MGSSALQLAADDYWRTRGGISVAVLAERRMLRESVSAMLNGLEGMRSVATEVQEATRPGPTPPDVHVVDGGARPEDTLEIVAALRNHVPSARTVVMELVPESPAVAALVSAGVAGFVLSDATLAELAATVRAVAAGGRILPQRLTGSLFAQLTGGVAARARRANASVRLSHRECQVVALIGHGMSNKQIAAELSITSHTVKSHVRNIMEKLRLHTRLHIAVYFNDQGGKLHHVECGPTGDTPSNG